MRLSKITVLQATLMTVLCVPLCASDYNSVDEQGVRVFSAVPEE
jgi:hypothetical protein